ncbi:MAG: bifunctional phosphoglucose/phosphomannose isomerase [Dehalococcoidia bacterium]
MNHLDDPRLYRDLDPQGMGSHLEGLPGQCQEAWQQALEFELPADFQGAETVVVVGMGGSAIGGDLLAGLAAREGVPVFIHRDYGLPPMVKEETLLIFSSYSGETEETLSAFQESLDTPAKKLALTSGGKLQALAQEQGIPVFPIGYQAQPRAALGYSLIPLLAFLQNLGLLASKSDDMEEMLGVLSALRERLRPGEPLASNPAKKLATQLQGRVSIVYGGGMLSAVARRWKTQLNENSKAWAFFELFPELNHNSITGYEFPRELAPKLLVALLHSPLLHPRTRLRYQGTREILSQRGVAHETVEAEGKSPLSHLMSLVYIGDWASYYLALLHGRDPTPVETIEQLKRQLAILHGVKDG